MTYRGHVENGVVLLDEGARLPDGTEVLVELAPARPAAPGSQADLLADLRRRSYAPPAGTPEGVELLRHDRER